jgi:trk system potassium uptake protein TrkH
VNVPSVLNVVGRLCLLFAGLLLLPLLVAAVDGELAEQIGQGFLVSAAVSGAVGLGLLLSFRLDRPSFDFEEGFAVVTFAWLAFAVLGSLPYVLSGAVPRMLDGLFETLSGLTTTGASVLPDPAALGRPLLFWRALTHWVGGMGVVALSIAILPALGAGGNFLYRAEVSGPTKDKHLPRISDVAKVLWSVYLGLTVAEVLALMLAGMGFFDALCHSFATVATGGFGTRADSLASFGPAVQWVVVVFMVLAGLNYMLLLGAVVGRPVALLRNAETRTWLGVLLLACVLGVVVLYRRDGAPLGMESLVRDVVFTMVSVSSTTGFATTDFGAWPVVLHVVLLLLMVGGACTGSTSGSAKMARHLMWAKGAWRELKRLLRPTAIFHVKLEGQTIPEGIVSKATAFLLFYLGATCLGTLLLTLFGMGGLESFSSMITCLSGVGPGLGAVGPTRDFAALPEAAKVLLMVAMLLGRLEFFAIMVLFSPLAWRR